MPFDQRPFCRDRRCINIVDKLHCMRIAHRQRVDFYRARADFQRIGSRALRRFERYACGLEHGGAHIDGDQTVRLKARHDNARGGTDADLGGQRKAFVMHKAHEATRTVAALLDLATVGVEDTVIKIGTGAARQLDLQNLIAADAETTVGELAQLRNAQSQRRARRIEHDKVIAQPVHLGEWQFHRFSDDAP